MASIELPDRATTAYLRECGGAAIYIVADGSGSCILGASVDLAAALAAVRKCDGNFHAVLAAVWWAPRHHVAQLIEIARREVAPVPVSARDVTTVTAAVERASRQMGLRLTDHGVAMARAKAAVEPLSGKVKPATDGDLRDFELKANGARIVLSTCPPTAEEFRRKKVEEHPSRPSASEGRALLSQHIAKFLSHSDKQYLVHHERISHWVLGGTKAEGE